MLEFYKVWFFFVNVYSSTVDVENYGFRDSWSLWLLMHDLWFKTIRSKSIKIFFFTFVCGTVLSIWYWWMVMFMAHNSRIPTSKSTKTVTKVPNYTGLTVWDNQVSDVLFVNHNRSLELLVSILLQSWHRLEMIEWFSLLLSLVVVCIFRLTTTFITK